MWFNVGMYMAGGVGSNEWLNADAPVKSVHADLVVCHTQQRIAHSILFRHFQKTRDLKQLFAVGFFKC